MYTCHTKIQIIPKQEFINFGGAKDTFGNLRKVIDSLRSALMCLYTTFHLITNSQEDNHGPRRKPMNLWLINLNLTGNKYTLYSKETLQ